MKVLGIEFSGNSLHYVLVEEGGEDFQVLQSNRLVLAETRSRDALIAFQNAMQTLYNATAPDRVAIKEKPESGRMKAGAAALKMEGITLANAPCPVEFISGARINQCTASRGVLPKYFEPALRAAVVALG
ncbi:DUF3010 family protein [Billgrantia endophytica]|uniref:DUF3010 domain-containing protein n=1 Tax=Billgrantia endophytica TaxID=2033802 RepID=A0A2N7U6J3_9GAMM|nr:DUF3010 family protein [Halomonas endophytica]PMR76063.1 hypothetical protein C1H69_06700 [Halomonas endophytica]